MIIFPPLKISGSDISCAMDVSQANGDLIKLFCIFFVFYGVLFSIYAYKKLKIDAAEKSIFVFMSTVIASLLVTMLFYIFS